jgi:DtxR family transcriptional regulator, Mn-dependent transcriptional regulator
MDPLTSLIAAFLTLALLVLLFFPGRGIIAVRNRIRKNSERILIEDALKHFYDCEYNELNCTLHSLAGILFISGEKTARLTGKLIAMGLIESRDGRLLLTAGGRSYALRVIRLHRLWERYLADETGLDEKYWHPEAEIKEHIISPVEAEALSAQLGHPLTDPHGDPIPSPSGEMAEQTGIPLGRLEKGVYASIVHIEDEPEAVYKQFIAQGLHTGMQICIIDKNDEKISVEADGNECVLVPLFASQIHVVPIRHSADIRHSFTPLSSLNEGEEARVVALSKRIRGQQRRRLMDLGLVPGTVVSAVMKSGGDGPVAYKIRGALIALRKNQTDSIFIERNGGNGK